MARLALLRRPARLTGTPAGPPHPIALPPPRGAAGMPDFPRRGARQVAPGGHLGGLLGGLPLPERASHARSWPVPRPVGPLSRGARPFVRLLGGAVRDAAAHGGALLVVVFRRS